MKLKSRLLGYEGHRVNMSELKELRVGIEEQMLVGMDHRLFKLFREEYRKTWHSSIDPVQYCIWVYDKVITYTSLLLNNRRTNHTELKKLKDAAAAYKIKLIKNRR